MNTIKSQVECFHLLFLDQLSRHLDSSLYAIKGGCNLRFFFNSIRYSEDLDIDIHTIAVETLKNKIDRLLNSMPFQQILQAQNIAIKSISLPKQTQTTQRWKLMLQTSASVPVNTKIEFSRRGIEQGVVYEPIASSVLQAYKLTPIFCTHYNKATAFKQKVAALAGRPQTQARDIFDLFLLLNAGVMYELSESFAMSQLCQAQDNALAISFEDFSGQVVAFLTTENQAHYNTPQLWEQIVINVVDQLEQLKP